MTDTVRNSQVFPPEEVKIAPLMGDDESAWVELFDVEVIAEELVVGAGVVVSPRSTK